MYLVGSYGCGRQAVVSRLDAAEPPGRQDQLAGALCSDHLGQQPTTGSFGRRAQRGERCPQACVLGNVDDVAVDSMVRPMPTAAPCTAAIKGFGNSTSAMISGANASPKSALSVPGSASARRSTPLENALPAPSTITTATASSRRRVVERLGERSKTGCIKCVQATRIIEGQRSHCSGIRDQDGFRGVCRHSLPFVPNQAVARYPSTVTAHRRQKKGPSRGPSSCYGATRELVVVEVAQQTQDLDVQPDQGDGEAECDAPGCLLGRLCADQLISGVEVEQEAEGCDADADEAEDDGERSAVTASPSPPSTKKLATRLPSARTTTPINAPMIIRVRTRCHPDRTGLVDDQHAEEHAERSEDCLRDQCGSADATELNIGEHERQRTEEQTLGDGVRQHDCRVVHLAAERSDQNQNEADETAADDQRGKRGRRCC